MREPIYSKEGTLTAATVETVTFPPTVGRVLIKVFGTSGHAKFSVDDDDPVLGAGDAGGGRIQAGGVQAVDVRPRVPRTRPRSDVSVKLLSASALEWSVEGYRS